MKTKRTKKPCEDCKGKGWLIFNDNQLQRCDQCQKFTGDLEAARAFFNDAASKGYTLQHITVARSAWVQLTKRTNDPKLSWLERQLDKLGIPHRRQGESFHAPIMQVPQAHYTEALGLLVEVDDLPDDHRRFNEP
jgi:hypothetical protein